MRKIKAKRGRPVLPIEQRLIDKTIKIRPDQAKKIDAIGLNLSEYVRKSIDLLPLQQSEKSD